MSLSFPLSIPSSPPGIRTVQMLGRSTVGAARSPFTGSQQFYEFPGEWWEAQFSLPPLARADAERWVSFLLALRGRGGTFLLGDPLGKTPQSTAGGSPIVNGAGQKGKLLSISGLTGVLKAGDYFHIGSAGENLLLWSQVFGNAVWTKNASGVAVPVVTDNAIVAPDGTTTAATFAYPSASGANNCFVGQSAAPQGLILQPFSCSVWLKVPSGSANITFFIDDAVAVNAAVQTISVTSTWQRFQINGIFSSATTGTFPRVLLLYQTAAIQTFHVWGWQLERGLVVNNYLPTTSAQAVATRQLLKNLTDAGPGSVTLDIFPKLRTSPLNADPLILTNSVGMFRLATNDQANWTVDVAKRYGIGVSAIEAF